MTEFKIELPKEVPPDSRAELRRGLQASAQVHTGAVQKEVDLVLTLFVVAATVQTMDIVWNWFQAARARAKEQHLDVVITTPDGKQVHLEKVTLGELKRLVG